MARGSHKSAYHAVYLRHLRVSYLYADIMDDYDICDAVTPEQVETALEKEPDIGAVFLVSPTYEGRIADVESIARIVHQRGIPLIVDEAHGAHLGLAEGFPKNSCQAGADIVIHSVHKTLPALTQSALLHVNGSLICRERLKRFLHIYQSSSPSYLLMASIENALRVASGEEGKRYFAQFYEYFCRMHRILCENCRHLRFLPLEEGRQDVGKLVISTRAANFSGEKLYRILLEKYHLQLEMAAPHFALAMFTIGDREEGYLRMTEALLALDRELEEEESCCRSAAAETNKGESAGFMRDMSQSSVTATGKALFLSAAWDMPAETVSLEQAAGRISAEFINLYPPGVPLLVPGERFTEEQCALLADYVCQGLTVQGIFNVPQNVVRVIAEKEECRLRDRA